MSKRSDDIHIHRHSLCLNAISTSSIGRADTFFCSSSCGPWATISDVQVWRSNTMNVDECACHLRPCWHTFGPLSTISDWKASFNMCLVTIYKVVMWSVVFVSFDCRSVWLSLRPCGFSSISFLIPDDAHPVNILHISDPWMFCFHFPWLSHNFLVSSSIFGSRSFLSILPPIVVSLTRPCRLHFCPFLCTFSVRFVFRSLFLSFFPSALFLNSFLFSLSLYSPSPSPPRDFLRKVTLFTERRPF